MDPDELSDPAGWPSVSPRQAAILGAIAGYMLGIMSGALVRFVLTIALFFVFILASRSIEELLESHLGLLGVLAVAVAFSAMGPLRSTLGEMLGSFTAGFSSLGLGLAGGLIGFKVHQRLTDRSDTDDLDGY